jgi:hypothetical protein
MRTEEERCRDNEFAEWREEHVRIPNARKNAREKCANSSEPTTNCKGLARALTRAKPLT